MQKEMFLEGREIKKLVDCCMVGWLPTGESPPHGCRTLQHADVHMALAPVDFLLRANGSTRHDERIISNSGGR